MANKQYTTLKNDYEMTLHANTSLVPCDDNEGVPTLQCDFVPIAELENRDKDSIIGKGRSSRAGIHFYASSILADKR